MPIDVLKDKLIPIDDVAKMFKRPGGKSVVRNTVLRWTEQGYRGIKLESARMGATLYTTEEALRVWSEAISHPEAPASKMSAAEVTRRHQEDEAFLASQGMSLS